MWFLRRPNVSIIISLYTLETFSTCIVVHPAFVNLRIFITGHTVVIHVEWPASKNMNLLEIHKQITSVVSMLLTAACIQGQYVGGD